MDFTTIKAPYVGGTAKLAVLPETANAGAMIEGALCLLDMNKTVIYAGVNNCEDRENLLHAASVLNDIAMGYLHAANTILDSKGRRARPAPGSN